MSNLSRIAAVVGALVLLGMLGLLGYILAPYFVDAENDRRAAFLDRASAQINENLPATVDESTRLERTTVEDETLVYHYVIAPPLADEIEPSNFAASYGAPVRRMVCGRQRLRALLDQDFTIAYRYRRDDGEELGRLAVAPSDCADSGT